MCVMQTFIEQISLFLVVSLLLCIHTSTQDESVAIISELGWEFIPIDSHVYPLYIYTTENLLCCQLQCNQLVSCRTYDFDRDSRQCRLWDGDTTTGSIIASPSKPRSSVGTIKISPETYANTHNQSCDKCVQSRYEICDINTSTCQCPSNTFWDGSMCLVQLFQGQICSRADACRLNLTCQPSCDFTYRCSASPVVGVGQTVAGFCNGTSGGGSTGIMGPWGIYVSQFDATLYVADYDFPRFQAFPPFSRTGLTILSTGLYTPEDIFVDSSSTIYMTDYWYNHGTVYIQQAGVNLRSFPAAGQSTNSCSLTGLYTPIGVVTDRFGNIYVSLGNCFRVVKWAPNATVGVLVAGQGGFGSASNQFRWARFIDLDEDRAALYVADAHSNRIQKFTIGGNGTGVSVAGNNGPGTGLNQLYDPSGIWVTKDGQTLYIADSGNNRVMKWTIGATQGSVVAGSASGVAGGTSQLLNYPGDVALDPTETFLYVSDYYNHRVQRFRLH